MRGAHDAGGPMHIQANVALEGEFRLARMQAHADAYRHTICPDMASQGTLPSYRCGNSIGGTGERHEEGLTLRVDLVTVILVERRT